MLDNHIYWGNALGIDPRRVAWRRVLDMNDRALREIVSSLGGVANGFPREDGFDITVASEVMAIFCLARDLEDLQEAARQHRSSAIPATASRCAPSDLKAQGAMAVLLKDALAPNLVQTLEGTPAFIHGGPFANIAHGCNSVLATHAGAQARRLRGDRGRLRRRPRRREILRHQVPQGRAQAGGAVLVATVRALKMHGGVAKDALGAENLPALEAGIANLARHVANMQKFGVPVVVAINRFTADTEAELDLVKAQCEDAFQRQALMVCDHWARGGAGRGGPGPRRAGLADSGKSQFQSALS